MSLGRYLESCAEHHNPQAGAFLEASECFWEAALQDHEHGCTDPPEVLRLQARDAQAKALQWSDKYLQSDIFLRASQHLCLLEEYDEAAFMAERSAELEAGSLSNAFDAHVAFGQSAKCHALNKNYLRVEKVLSLMLETAEKALEDDSSWPGFVKGPVGSGWHSSWTEEAIMHASIANLFLCVVTGRNELMTKWLDKAKALLTLRDGEPGPVWEMLKLLVECKQSESEPGFDSEHCRAVCYVVIREDYARVLLEAAMDSVKLLPNWSFIPEKNESKLK